MHFFYWSSNKNILKLKTYLTSSLQYKEKYVCMDVERTSEEALGIYFSLEEERYLLKICTDVSLEILLLLLPLYSPLPTWMSIWSFSSYHKECSFEGWKKTLYLKASFTALHLTSGLHVKPSVLYFHSIWN